MHSPGSPLINTFFSNSGAPPWVRDAVLEGVRITTGNMHTCSIGIVNDHICSEWEREILFIAVSGSFAKNK